MCEHTRRLMPMCVSSKLFYPVLLLTYIFNNSLLILLLNASTEIRLYFTTPFILACVNCVYALLIFLFISFKRQSNWQLADQKLLFASLIMAGIIIHCFFRSVLG